MKLRHTTVRLAVAGSTVALLAGGLVATTGTAAHAATGSANYNCTNGFTPDILPLTLTATADLTLFPSFPSGFGVPADSVPVDLTVELSQEVVAGLKANGGISTVGATSEGMNFPFGSGAVPLQGFNVPAIPKAEMPSEGAFVMEASSSNGDFLLPAAGNLEVDMPTSFSLTNVIPIPIDCTLDGESTPVTTYTVTKQGSTLVAKAPKSVAKGKPVPVAVTVTGANIPATGKVVAKEGKKMLGSATLKKGKAVIVVKGLKPGKHAIDVTYAGDKSTSKSNNYIVNVTVKK